MQAVFEKIIETLEEECFLTTNDDGETNELSIKVVDLNDAIEIVKQEAEKFGLDTNVGTNGWIPCSERLPKYGEVVMCSCTNSGITISCITHKGVKPSKSVRFGQHSVIAWQPLPQPYQPKGE